MKKNTEAVEKRLENLKKVYSNIESIVDNIPEAVPKKIRKQIKDSILGDKDLKELMGAWKIIDHQEFFLWEELVLGKAV